VREGIEDGWYLSMLESELSQIRSPSKAAEHAEALLDRLKNRIPDDFSQYFERARRYDPTPGPPKNFAITPEEMDTIRAEIAEAIIGLRESNSATKGCTSQC
jgi:hypothetical protein